MALTRDFKKTVVARIERDTTFARELLDEATMLLVSCEAETARVILRDLVNATLGFERLSKLTDVPSKSLITSSPISAAILRAAGASTAASRIGRSRISRGRTN